jgi:hypothetical protein
MGFLCFGKKPKPSFKFNSARPTYTSKYPSTPTVPTSIPKVRVVEDLDSADKSASDVENSKSDTNFSRPNVKPKKEGVRGYGGYRGGGGGGGGGNGGSFNTAMYVSSYGGADGGGGCD